MPTLTPTQAAEIAMGVYQLRTQTVSAMRESGRNQLLGSEGLFRVDDQSTFSGRSGMLLWKPLSGFGYIAEGEGAFQGEVLVATRGTAIAADWATDAAMSMQRGPSGHPVHGGFNQIHLALSTEKKKQEA